MFYFALKLLFCEAQNGMNPFKTNIPMLSSAQIVHNYTEKKQKSDLYSHFDLK